jgi:hypothetical protein
MRSLQFTVTAERSIIVAADDINRTVYINVTGNTAIAVGGSNVTYANGLIFEKHDTPHEVFVPLKELLYAVCDTGASADVRVLLPNGD